MKFALIALTLLMAACSSKPVLTKYNSPVMRVMVDPSILQTRDYTSIQNALVKSGKWVVLDRAAAFHASVAEQDLQYGEGTEGRFDDKEKFAHFAKLHGAGGVIVADIHCEMKMGFVRGPYNECRENLSIVNATTTEVIATAEVMVDSIGGVNSSAPWDEAVDALNHNFPKRLDDRIDDELVAYKEETKKLAEKRREH